MSVYLSKTHLAFLYNGDSTSFLITSHNLAMEYHFIQREGSDTTDRFMLVHGNRYLTHAPTSDGPLDSDAESIFLLFLRIRPNVYMGPRFMNNVAELREKKLKI